MCTYIKYEYFYVKPLYPKLLNYIHKFALFGYCCVMNYSGIRSIIPLLYFMTPTVAATISTPPTAAITPTMMTKTIRKRRTKFGSQYAVTSK